MYKCKICNKQFKDLASLLNHIESKHKEMIPQDMNVHQYYYYMKTGKTHGNCVMCKNPTEWNKNTNKYNRFCDNPVCKEKYREIFKKRMIGKYGKTHLLNDPEKQREMLAHRKISGKYKWENGTETTYTGTYDLDFLKLLDGFFEWDPNDISMPSPHNYSYIYDGVEKFYFPDVFIHSLDLEIEIKDGGNNPNTHPKIQHVDKVKEKLKDEVMTSQKSFNYIKIYNKNYINFFEFLKLYKQQFEKYGESSKIPKIFLIEDKERVVSNPPKKLTESFDFSDEDMNPTYEITSSLFNKAISTVGQFLLKDKLNNIIIYDIQAHYNKPDEVKKIIQNALKTCKDDNDFEFVESLVKRSVDYYEKNPTDGWVDYKDWIRYKYRKEEKEIKKKNKKKAKQDGLYKMIESYVISDKSKNIDLSYALVHKYLKNKDDECLTKLLNDYTDCYNRELKERPEAKEHINNDVKKTIDYIDSLEKQGLVDREFTEKHKPKLQRLVESNDTILTLIYEKSINRKLFNLMDDTSKLYIGDKYFIKRPEGKSKINCIVSEGDLSKDILNHNILQYKLTTNDSFNENIIMKNLIEEGLDIYGLYDLQDDKNIFLHDICKTLNIDGTIKKI